MICKPIVIKCKRSRSSFQNTHNPNKNQSRSYIKDSEWENSLVSLNNVLNNIKDDTIKRYNTEIDRYVDLNIPTPVSSDTNKLKNSLTKQDLQLRTSSKFRTLEPEPWFNDNQMRKYNKPSKTNSNMNSSHFSLPKDWEQRNSLNKSNRNSSYRDKQEADHQIDKNQRINKITKLIEQNQALWTESFNYTNQQKAKVSIDYLLHEQKHKKMEKILKYKQNLIVKPGIKKDKINQHSKYLVDMLKKLSKQHLFASSLNQTRTQTKRKAFLKGNTNSKKTPFHTFDQCDSEDPKNQNPIQSRTQMKSASCCNLTIENQRENKIGRKRTKPACSIKDIEAVFQEEETKQIHNYKMTFKPRRNIIFEKRASSNSQSGLKKNEIKSLRKLSDKQFAVTNHFLKIKKVKA